MKKIAAILMIVVLVIINCSNPTENQKKRPFDRRKPVQELQK